MRNKEERKNKKGQESTIGKIIYGFLLFMPLIAIFVTCGYAIFNKNAYQSYYGKNINEETDNFIDIEDLENGNTYYFKNDYYFTIPNTQTQNIFTYLYVDKFEDLKGNFYQPDFVDYLVYYYSTNNTPLLRVYYEQGNSKDYNLRNDVLNFKFYLRNAAQLDVNPYLVDNNFFYIPTFNEGTYISEVFYYAVNKVTETPLFNWATNSIIYTTTNATCNALSITTPFVPLILAYWLIISVIYFLYDIALMLVWMIHKKIHELQESF